MERRLERDQQPLPEAGRRYGFPWGSNQPTKGQRIAVSLLIAGVAVLALLYRLSAHPGAKTDFDLVLFGARMMMAGRDPYPLVGPGLEFEWDFGLIYPATAFVAVLPFTILSMKMAAAAFVALSMFLLSYALTEDSWHRLPIFGSAAFVDSAISAQWSPIIIASLSLPMLAIFASAKPQLSFAILAGTRSKYAVVIAFFSTIILVGISLYFLPEWPQHWLHLLRADTGHMKAAVTQPFGAVVLLLVLRWR
ncbi:MAG: hypothetical protein H0T48_16000, partial [Gemmatimonadaceae bacterium]|nr:hypothetical protein [Gemmatimonadaceae bacterium]